MRSHMISSESVVSYVTCRAKLTFHREEMGCMSNLKPVWNSIKAAFSIGRQFSDYKTTKDVAAPKEKLSL